MTSLTGASDGNKKGLNKTFWGTTKAFIKPFEAPKRSVKINFSFTNNFYFTINFLNAQDGKG